MRSGSRAIRLPLFTLLLLLLAGRSGHAQEDQAPVNEDVLGALAPDEDPDEPLEGFYDTADLSLVITGGNSSATTFGLRNLAEYYWPTSSLRLDIGGLSTSSRAQEDRFARGTGEDDFEVVNPERQKTAENYFATLRFDHDISDRIYAFTIAGWERNRFAGFDDRIQGALGLGWFAVDTERTKLRFDAAATYTSESPVLGDQNNFGGIRLAYDYEQHLSESTTFLSILVVDENLKNTDDLRADWFNALELSITDTIFLRTSLRLQWRNDPLFESLPLFDEDGKEVLDENGDQVTVPSQLDSLDTYFVTSLVLKI